jgi:hypothetical protein
MLGNFDSTNTSKKLKLKTHDKQFILNVVNKTTEYIGKRLLRNEIEGLVQYMREVDYNLFTNDSPQRVVDKLAKNFARQLSVTGGTAIDTHEIMKREISGIKHDDSQSLYQDMDCPQYTISGRSSVVTRGVEGFGTRARNTEETDGVYLNNENTNIATPSTKRRVQNVYLLLDSKYRNLSTDPSVFKWTVLNSANTTQGTVNTLSDQIHNITNIQFDRFAIPYVASADNVYKKITMFVEEFSSMAVLINSGRRYHMLFDSNINGNQIDLTPQINDEGRFRFHTPINVLDTITIKFMSPFSPVQFLPDRFNIRITSLNTTQSILTFTAPHQMVDGELVHLEGFSTTEPTDDSQEIATINREEGHIVTFMNNTELRIDVGIESATLDPTNIAVCFIAARRLIIPIRMEYLL